MEGPRQGVHLSPQHIQQWRQLHRFVQWRKFQFRDPDATYVYRARIEPRPPQLPTPPAEPKQHNAAFPSRSHLLKRPSSARSGRPCSATPTSPSHQSSRPMQVTSTTTLCSSTPNRQTQSSNKQVSMGGPATAESGRQLSGSEFTLSATAISIQPRQPTQRSLATGKTNKQLIVNSASFSYLDPTKVKGDPRFVFRLGELAKLEAETIRSEQAKARLMLSARSRPASARSIKSSVAASNNSKWNGYTYQSNRRTNATGISANVSKGGTASIGTVKRLNSSPAVGTYNRSANNTSSSLTVSKQKSCTDIPTQTRANRVNGGGLNSVKEMAPKLSVTESVGVAEDESKVQRSSTPPNVDAVEVEVGPGDGSKDQRSCSPPIVRIPAPPFKCSWSVGEGEGDMSIEKHGVRRENYPEGEGERESKAESISKEITKENPSSPLYQGNPAFSCENGRTPPGDHSDRVIVEDDLKVTSDLGLSIDSLHLSEEDNTPETTPSDKVHPHQNGVDHLDTNAFGNGIESGLSEPYDGSIISAKTLVIPSSDKLTEYELDTISESGSTTKRVRRKKGGGGCKKGTKLSNGSSSTQPAVAASSLSTSLKTSKTTVRNSHKTTKQSVKRYTKK